MSDERISVDPAAVWPTDTDTVEAVVSNWFIREGGHVDEGKTVCEIQVDKVSVDVVAPTSGTVDEVVVGEGGDFEKGDALAWIRPD